MKRGRVTISLCFLTLFILTVSACKFKMKHEIPQEVYEKLAKTTEQLTEGFTKGTQMLADQAAGLSQIQIVPPSEDVMDNIIGSMVERLREEIGAEQLTDRITNRVSRLLGQDVGEIEAGRINQQFQDTIGRIREFDLDSSNFDQISRNREIQNHYYQARAMLDDSLLYLNGYVDPLLGELAPYYDRVLKHLHDRYPKLIDLLSQFLSHAEGVFSSCKQDFSSINYSALIQEYQNQVDHLSDISNQEIGSADFIDRLISLRTLSQRSSVVFKLVFALKDDLKDVFNKDEILQAISLKCDEEFSNLANHFGTLKNGLIDEFNAYKYDVHEATNTFIEALKNHDHALVQTYGNRWNDLIQQNKENLLFRDTIQFLNRYVTSSRFSQRDFAIDLASNAYRSSITALNLALQVFRGESKDRLTQSIQNMNCGTCGGPETAIFDNLKTSTLNSVRAIANISSFAHDENESIRDMSNGDILSHLKQFLSEHENGIIAIFSKVYDYNEKLYSMYLFVQTHRLTSNGIETDDISEKLLDHHLTSSSIVNQIIELINSHWEPVISSLSDITGRRLQAIVTPGKLNWFTNMPLFYKRGTEGVTKIELGKIKKLKLNEKKLPNEVVYTLPIKIVTSSRSYKGLLEIRDIQTMKDIYNSVQAINAPHQPAQYMIPYMIDSENRLKVLDIVTFSHE